MNIEEINQIRKDKGISVEELALLSKLPKSTVEKVLFGIVKHPRIDTMQAIERALGITSKPNLSAEQQELFSLIQSLSDDEVKAMNDYLTYLLSKRK